MRVLVTGAGGQLGWDVMEELRLRGHKALGTDLAAEAPGPDMDYAQLDITDAGQVAAVLARFAPDAVIHCAAWTQVDLAEEPENREKVWAVNAEGTRHIAQACKRLGCKLLYISTDYVFGGQGESPWKPGQTDFAPLNVYGQTKLEGERAVRELVEKYFIVRIAWVFGGRGANFVKTMLRLSETHPSLRVVDDQIGTPTYTRHLARLLADICESERYGCYHATNEGGYISWYQFAREIFRLAGRDVEVLPVSTREYGQSKAARPFNSRLDKTKLIEAGFTPLPPWQEALAHFLESLGENS